MAVQLEVPEAEPPRIELAPLVDMVFLLLIFFMVGAQFARPVFDLDLPEAGAGSSAPRVAATIVVDAQGQLYLDTRPLEFDALVQQLRQASEAEPDAAVLLRADAATPFRAIVQAFDAAESAGVHNLSIEHARAGATRQ